MIRGFFGRFASGVEQRRPELLLENAVADELDNLKKLQAAAARTMAYEKMLSDDLAEKQKLVAARERQAKELASRGEREAAVEALRQKQEAESNIEELEGRLEEARSNSEEMREAFEEQERRYNDVVRERSALMEERQRAQAMRAANEARSNLSLSDSSRDLDKARQAIRQSSYEAEAVGELGSSTGSVERQLSNAEDDIKRFEAERELEDVEAQMGIRSPRELEDSGEDEEEER
jgi:phage shock protein A